MYVGRHITIFVSSVSYDGTMKIWDSRALMPLHTVKDAHELRRKYYVDWKVEDTIVSGLLIVK